MSAYDLWLNLFNLSTSIKPDIKKKYNLLRNIPTKYLWAYFLAQPFKEKKLSANLPRYPRADYKPFINFVSGFM